MVRSAGFEPATPGLGILCSIQLSYDRITGISLHNIFYVLKKIFNTTYYNY